MKPKPVINKLYFLLFACITLTSVIIESCKKDNHTDQQANITDPAILGAKNWYEKTYAINPGKQNTQAIDTSIDWSQRVKPDWNHPASYNRFDNDVIEMPLDASSKMAIGLKNTKSGQAVYNPDYSRSSFLLLKQEGIYNAYIMTIIADAAYLKGDITKLDRNKYNKRDSDFSGAVIYSTPKGQFVSGWLYKNGVLINKISTVEAPSTGSVSTKGGKTIQSVKTNGWIAMQTITDWYQLSMPTGMDVIVTYLGYTTSVSYEYVDDGEGEPTPPVSDPGNGGGGAGGSGSSTEWVPPPCPDGYPVPVINSIGHKPVTYIAKPPDKPDDGSGFPSPEDKQPPCSVGVSKITTPYPEITLDKNGAGLCGSIPVTQVANSWTGSVSNLSFTAYINQDGVTTEIPVSFGTICFEIPSDGNVTAITASEKFIAAYNLALNMAIAAIHGGEIQPTSPAIRAEVSALVFANLNAFRAGSSFATGPCAGNIASTPAPYCRN